ncbi:MAG: hypothetical protein ABFS43_05365 [Thermodesulfobacteriota bacterium]
MNMQSEHKEGLPWWLKLVLLLMLGLPGISGWPNGWLVQKLVATDMFTPEIAHIVVWVAYACCVWLVVLFWAGQQKLLNYLGAAFVLALTVAMLGAILRGLFPVLAAGLSREATSFKLIRIFINIIIFLPFSVLFINSFSAKKLIDRVAHLEGRHRTIGLHLALAFRVFQHTGEVVFNLFQIWTEEYPEKIVPRNTGSQGFRWYAPRDLLAWVWGCIHAWIFACIIHTFEPIPAMVAEVERIDRTNNNHKDTKSTKDRKRLH